MRKKGFSLVEAIVCIALFALLMSFVWPLLSSTMAQRKRANEMARLEMYLRNITELILAEQDPQPYLWQINHASQTDPPRYNLLITYEGRWMRVCLTDVANEEQLCYEIYP